MAVRPLTSAQRAQHRAFLRHLALTGNAAAAARAIGMSDATLIYRRKRHPAFAVKWDATLAAADARLHARGGAQPAPGKGEAETTVTLRRDGRLQLRRARADAFTRAAEQRFLLALSASANVSLSAAAAGVSVAAVNKRRRANPAFAREARAALAQGYERLELALMQSWSPASGEDSAWRGNDPPALPPMTPQQALQLLHLHHRQVRWRETVFPGRLLAGETSDLRSAKMARLYRAKLTADAEERVARDIEQLAVRSEKLAPPPIALPDLAQVKGWSKADPEAGEHGPEALFGGWRIDNLTPEQRRGVHGLGEARRKTRPARRASARPTTDDADCTYASGPTRPPTPDIFREDATPEEIRRWLYGAPEEDE